jgi:predicted dehydrogenase
MAVRQVRGLQLSLVCDSDFPRAEMLASKFECEAVADWRSAVERAEIEIVIVSTPNDLHAPIAIAAMNNGKHVLCEKPLARTPEEAEAIVIAARSNRVRLKVGLNYRFHPQVGKAFELLAEGRIGTPIFCRGAIGHAGALKGRPGFERSWFRIGSQSGGGTLVDNGCHLMDLGRLALGEFVEVADFTSTIPEASNSFVSSEHVEDNAGGIFKTADGRLFLLHSSWTHWGRSMIFEIGGTEGTLTIDNDSRTTFLTTRDGSHQFDFSHITDDVSRARELEELLDAIRDGREPWGNGYDGLQAVRLAHALYQASLTRRAVRLESVAVEIERSTCHDKRCTDRVEFSTRHRQEDRPLLSKELSLHVGNWMAPDK